MLKTDVVVSPGVAFGEFGEGYVRVGLVENEQRIRQAAKNIKKLFILDFSFNIIYTGISKFN